MTNRRSFLSTFLKGSLATIVAPQVVAHGLGLKSTGFDRNRYKQLALLERYGFVQKDFMNTASFDTSIILVDHYIRMRAEWPPKRFFLDMEAKLDRAELNRILGRQDA